MILSNETMRSIADMCGICEPYEDYSWMEMIRFARAVEKKSMETYPASEMLKYIAALEEECKEASKCIRGLRDGGNGWYAQAEKIAALEKQKYKYLTAWDSLQTWLSFNYLEIMEEYDKSHPEEG